ncbi:hypothetical protein TYRP_015860 [Tyrophagus putrescentiae]|nr:hypothetical protein TYRP_015860 [Tyrophagus putrescentiae]
MNCPVGGNHSGSGRHPPSIQCPIRTDVSRPETLLRGLFYTAATSRVLDQCPVSLTASAEQAAFLSTLVLKNRFGIFFSNEFYTDTMEDTIIETTLRHCFRHLVDSTKTLDDNRRLAQSLQMYQAVYPETPSPSQEDKRLLVPKMSVASKLAKMEANVLHSS